MADEPTTGETPASSDPTPTGQAPAVSNDAPTEPVTSQEPDWDPERAKATITNLRAKEKELAKQAKEQAAQAAELQKRLEALENEKLTEDQRKQKAYEESQAKLAAYERQQADWARERQEILTRHAVASAAAREVKNGKDEIVRAAFHDPDDAYAHLDLAALEYDEDGKPTNVEALVSALAKAKPYLVKAASNPSQSGPVAAGSPSNPARGAATQPPAETHEQAYRRILGTPPNLFDPAWAAERGGGVRPPESGVKER